MKTTILFCALLGSLWLSTEAHANNDFSVTAETCVPGDPAINSNRYTSTAGRVQHRPTNVDLITLYCPISGTIDPPANIELVYLDTNTASTTYVTASYIKMSKATGGITTVATASSQTGTQNGSVHYVSVGFSDVYDVTSYVYYVRVDIDRNTTSDTAAFYATTVW